MQDQFSPDERSSGAQAAPSPGPWGRHRTQAERGSPFGSPPPHPRGARALALPQPALARLVGPLRPGEVLLLGGEPDLLGACAHAFLVQAVGEGPTGREGPPEHDLRAVVVDGGNNISPYAFAAGARAAGEDPELLTGRVRLARAFTAHQMVSLMTRSLEAELGRAPCDLLAVLTVRGLFEDEDLEAAEARQLARLACGGLRNLAARRGVPCLVTSPSPAREPLALALERIAEASATRVVSDLHYGAIPGAAAGRGGPAPGRALGLSALQKGQLALDGWGEMPARRARVGPSAAGPSGGILIRAHWTPRKPVPSALVRADDKQTSETTAGRLKVERRAAPET